MYSIVFFGKPERFEAIEFNNGSLLNDNSTIEPRFKATASNDRIFRQFFVSEFWYLQAYEYAQAYTGGRTGTDIGVALKSEQHIQLSKNNLDMLSVILDKFKEAALDGKKYKSDNLRDIVNYFVNTITTITNLSVGLDKVQPSNDKRLLYLKNIKDNIGSLPAEVYSLADMYISDNNNLYTEGINTLYYLDFGNRFYTIDSKGNLTQYKEPISPDPQPTGGGKGVGWGGLVGDIYSPEPTVPKSKYDELLRQFHLFKQSAAKKFRIASVAAVVFCLSTIAFFFKGHFGDTQPNSETNTATVISESQPAGNTSQPIQSQDGMVSLTDIMDDDRKRNTLASLLQNIAAYNKPLKNKTIDESKRERYLAIVRHANTLGINSSFAEKYKPDEKSVALTTGEEAKKKADDEAKKKADKEAKKKADDEAKKKADDEVKKKADDEAKKKADDEAKKKADDEAEEKAGDGKD